MKRALSDLGTTIEQKQTKRIRKLSLGRTMTPEHIVTPEYLSTEHLLQPGNAALKGYTEVTPAWTTQVGHYVPNTDETISQIGTERRALVVSWPQSVEDRAPTFYSERFLRTEHPGAVNFGKPQGPHSVADVLNEKILDQYLNGKRGADALAALKTAFNDLIRPPSSAEELVRAMVPNFDTARTDLASGVRAALDAYRQQHGSMIQRLNTVDPGTLTTKGPIGTLRNEMLALMSLDPASTYGWERQELAPPEDTKGKGEGAAMQRLLNARAAYVNSAGSLPAEGTRQILRMAKEFDGWLLDRPTTMHPEQKAAIEEIQAMRMKAFLKDLANKDAVVNQIKAELPKDAFKNWLQKEKFMRRRKAEKGKPPPLRGPLKSPKRCSMHR